ncbi:metal-sulfur cluster assembly factor [Paenibacillus sp. NPDC056579]|uniref:metal-sulfur cluster assembly factor n=1 Tax=Paenibacillus sp. NPDC056579 TaxID=3345871 RepID=UPI0036A9608F
MSKEDLILAELEEVIDPEVGVNVVDLGLIYEVKADQEGTASIKMTLTIPECPLADEIVSNVKQAALKAEGIHKVDVELVFEPKWSPAKMNDLAKEQIRARHSMA